MSRKEIATAIVVVGSLGIATPFECRAFEFLAGADQSQTTSQAQSPTPATKSDTVSVTLPGGGGATSGATQEWKRVAPGSESITSTGARAGGNRSAADTVPTETAIVRSMRAASLEAEIANIREQIRLSEEDNARYSGGLVKSLIGARLATMRQTEAMLRQASITPRHGADASSNDALRALEEQVADSNAQIARQQIETDRYSGGLIRATSLVTLATLQQTLAILDQRRLILKYGLRSNGDAQAPPAPIPTAAARVPEIQKDWRIVSVDARVTESNTVWSRFAWKLTLDNDSDRAQSFQGTIEFQDSDGFIVDTSNPGQMLVPAQSEQVFTGFALIKAELVGKVARAVAKVGAFK